MATPTLLSNEAVDDEGSEQNDDANSSMVGVGVDPSESSTDQGTIDVEQSEREQARTRVNTKGKGKERELRNDEANEEGMYMGTFDPFSHSFLLTFLLIVRDCSLCAF